jgi:serine/threonine protein kinase/formylglycine-generating enzyme required for sulfatase activity
MDLSKPTGTPNCLSDEILVDLIDGRLPGDLLARAHQHASGCESCRELMVAVFRGNPEAKEPLPIAQGARPGDVTQTLPGPDPKAPPARAGTSGPDNSWTPPVEFDEFRIERMIGRGGMGIVYLAQDTSLGRTVAVKFMASKQPGPLARAYFETEARAIARLQHPNVVSVFRVGAIEDHPYIVSEYVVGRSLGELPLPLPWRRVLSLGLGLARGLAAAHRKGVLHRDIKPSNALVTEEGEVKLLDFGLAERFDASESLPSPGAPSLVGTPRYMAPEILRGQPGTPQSDLYSLGLTLYELLAGSLPPRALPKVLPFGAPSQAAASAMDEKAPTLGLESGIDPDFAALITRCLAPDPVDRFASAELFCEALERLDQLHTTAPLAADNPYRGLAPFEAEHRSLFFGRDADIRAVLDRLRRQPLVLVAGDSGVGKSSLCRAGVVPRVAAGALDESREITTVTLWPGHRPLEALAAALAPLLGKKEAELATTLAETPGYLGQALREAYQGRRGLLLFIDQLEELITLAEPDQAARFAAILGELALPSTGVRVLLAIRGDFLTRVSALPGLGDEAERALYILRPMSPEGIREAIIGPARSRGVSFESEALIGTLVASTAHSAGSLPLLQFALAELWERRTPAQSRLTLAALGEMGGVAGALSRHADGVLQLMSPVEQQAARRILLRLVTAEGMRLHRREEELVSASDLTSRTALHVLLEGRILYARTAGAQAEYELAHDSLMVSWGTLRNWLDDDIGHRAVRQRVEAASAEWDRLGHSKEALWGQRHLYETRPLDPTTLGPRERAFLAASRRALRVQRWSRYAIVLSVALALASIYGGLRLQAYLEDARFVTERLAAAQAALDTSQALRAQARESRQEALKLFDPPSEPSSSPGTSPAAHELWEGANQKWRETLSLYRDADKAAAHATHSLGQAIERAHGHREARRLLTELTYERLLLAEEFQQKHDRDELLVRLEVMLDATEDGAKWRERLSTPAEFELVTEPPGARVEIERYVPNHRGAWHLEPVPESGLTPLTRTLPAGSYRLRITQPDRAPVVLPLLLTRGSREPIRLVLPTTVPEGYVYIPSGCFLLGSDDPDEVRRFMSSSPIHRSCMKEGYLIGRTEVTFGDWLDYLNSLPQNAPARRILEQPRFSVGWAVTLRHQPGTGWIFSFHRSSSDVLTASEGEPFHHLGRTRRDTSDWRKFPLSGVSAEDLAGFFYWLDRSGRLPGARLCTEHEWERAARGADERAYPHGDQLRVGEANIDTTYDRQPTGFGPDMVGSYPVSTSPFGLVDIAGNAFELTRAVTEDRGRIVNRGGGWYYEYFGARIVNRTPSEPQHRDVMVGARVCASLPNAGIKGEESQR